MSYLYQLIVLLRIAGPKQLLKIQKTHRAMLEYARSYMAMHCLLALENIGVLSSLSNDGIKDLESYALSHQLDKDRLISVCEYLFSLRILDKNNDGYCLSCLGKEMLTYSQGAFNFIFAYAPIFEDLESLLKSKKVYGRDIHRRNKFVAMASAQIGSLLPLLIMKDVIKKYNIQNLIDLGCGSGEFLINLCGDSKLSGMGIDISIEAVAYGQKLVKEHGLENRITLLVGDILKNEEIKLKLINVDAIVSMFVLHEFLAEGNTRVVELLIGLKEQFKGKRLIIFELCKNSPELLRKKGSAIAEHHLFHALSGQRLITKEEWCDIFKNSNLNIKEDICFDFAGLHCFILEGKDV